VNTYDRLVEIISEVMGVEPRVITEKTNLFEDLEADSITVLEIVSRIEEKWKFELTDYPELLDEIETIQSLTEFLDHCIGVK
jgi:Acyl carrier protein